MSPGTRSAFVRAARTAIQVVAAWAVSWLIVQVPALEPQRDPLMLLSTIGLSALFAWGWRRWIDPSSVPSLVDPDTAEAEAWRNAA